MSDVIAETTSATVVRRPWVGDGAGGFAEYVSVDRNSPVRYIAQLVARGVDGIIVVSQRLPANFELPVPGRPPMVFADCPGSPAPSIVFDVSATIAEAVTHLIDHGHRRIGLISPPATFPNMRPIIESHRKTLLDAGLPCDDDLVPEVTDFSLESGGRALEALTSTSNPATAAITAADDLALGGIRAARRMGIVIPRNFALIGFGETPYASLAEPPLTTVTLPVSDLGATAMTMMRRMIAGDPGDAHTVSLPSHLTIRRSCGSHK